MPRDIDVDVDTSLQRVDPLVGTIFDKRFRVEEKIASGGFGAIYRATHVKSQHRVALKVLLPSLAKDLGVVARFRREGDTLTALRNPHTINAYELGQAGDRTLFIVMELLYGESLFERYKANGPFEWKRLCKIARQVCESLEEAHARGIVHRDLKPTNIHLEKHDDDIDFVKVLDFGIAKILRGGDFEAADITNAGQMIGTIDYMSPEQMVGGKVSGQTDIYTLGIVMYEMIAGCTPFPEAMTAAQALNAVMKTKPDPLYLRAPVPEELDRIVMRCLERDLAKRYQTVTELRLDLARLLAGIAPDRSAAVETKPVVKQDEPTQFTPPPERLLDELRRSPDHEETQFTPPPQQLLAESRRARRPSDEHTAFTPPPEAVLAELRAGRRKHSPVVEWTDEDEREPTTDGVERPGRPRSTEEHERVTKVARLADIAAAAARSHDEQPTSRADEHDRVTKVARLSDIAARPASGEEQPTTARVGSTRGGSHEPMTSVARWTGPSENEPVTSVARLSEAAARMPRGNAMDRAATGPRDAAERATTLPHDASERAMTVPVPRGGPARNDGSALNAATPPLASWSDAEQTEAWRGNPAGARRDTPTTSRRAESGPRREPPARKADSSARRDELPSRTQREPAHNDEQPSWTEPEPRTERDREPPVRRDAAASARKPETMPPPIPSTARKAETMPPPLPGLPRAVPRSVAPPAPLPGMPAPPRTFTPQQDGSHSRRSDTPIPQLGAAAFSQPKLPTPVPSTMPAQVITPPGVSPYAVTEHAMKPHVSQSPYGSPGLQSPQGMQPHVPTPLPYGAPSQSYGVPTPPPMQPYGNQPGAQPYGNQTALGMQPYAPSPQTMQPPGIPSPLPQSMPPPLSQGMPAQQLPMGQPFGPTPYPPTSLGGQPYPPMMPPPLSTSFPSAAPPTRSFDMGKMAAREAAMSRLIWIIALILAAGVGIILATQL
ncbi:MAG TPA: protein kinase [Kofleriaceae bacterium]